MKTKTTNPKDQKTRDLLVINENYKFLNEFTAIDLEVKAKFNGAYVDDKLDVLKSICNVTYNETHANEISAAIGTIQATIEDLLCRLQIEAKQLVREINY